MKRSRQLEAVVDQANHMLQHSTCSRDNREGVIALVSAALHASNTYKGFRYLDATEVPAGHLPGIVRNVRPLAFPPDTGHDFPDETRRQYY